MQTGHPIQTRKPDENDKISIFHLMNLFFPEDHRVKTHKSEKIVKYLDLARVLKTTGKHEVYCDNNCKWRA